MAMKEEQYKHIQTLIDDLVYSECVLTVTPGCDDEYNEVLNNAISSRLRVDHYLKELIGVK